MPCSFWPSLVLVRDDSREHDIVELGEQILLGAPERDLVAHLVEVAERAAALAVEAAHRHVDLLRDVGGAVDVLGPDQPGQVEHDRQAQPRAGVGGARGQEAELLGEGDRHPLDQRVVELLRAAEGAVELEAGLEHLHAQVVLLVEHDRDRLLGVDRDAARAAARRQFTADQVALDQHRELEFVDRV
jgi:hypothetical protein